MNYNHILGKMILKDSKLNLLIQFLLGVKIQEMMELMEKAIKTSHLLQTNTSEVNLSAILF